MVGVGILEPQQQFDLICNIEANMEPYNFLQNWQHL